MAKKAKKAKKTAKKPARKMAKKSAKPVKKVAKKGARTSSRKLVKKTAKKKTVRAMPARGAAKSSRTAASRGTSSAAPKGGRSSTRSRSSGDFGIPALEARDRARAGEDLMHNETEPRTARGSVVGNRESGAGAPDSGPGSSSGGDVDTDVIGVGTGVGLAQSGPSQLRDIGLAETDGSSDEFASGPPAKGENQGPRPNRVDGSTVTPLDDDESNAI